MIMLTAVTPPGSMTMETVTVHCPKERVCFSVFSSTFRETRAGYPGFEFLETVALMILMTMDGPESSTVCVF
jgi:hypothetical protein